MQIRFPASSFGFSYKIFKDLYFAFHVVNILYIHSKQVYSLFLPACKQLFPENLAFYIKSLTGFHNKTTDRFFFH
jgi:hypothetical protein